MKVKKSSEYFKKWISNFKKELNWNYNNDISKVNN